MQQPTKIISTKYHNCLDNYTRNYNGHFFDADTLRFFNSKIYNCFYYDRFFITSEKYNDEPRLYTVRMVCPISNNIETIGDFQAFKTKKQAENFISKYMSKELSNIINLVRLYANTNTYKRSVQSYINKNRTAFDLLLELDIFNGYYTNYLAEFKN